MSSPSIAATDDTFAPNAAPTIAVAHYEPTRGRLVVRAPYIVADGRRYLAFHWREGAEVPTRKTTVQLIIGEGGEADRYLVLLRYGEGQPENERLAAMSGGVRWRGDIVVARRGSRRGFECINLPSLSEADLVVRLLLMYRQRYGMIEPAHGFVRSGADPLHNTGDMYRVNGINYRAVDEPIDDGVEDDEDEDEDYEPPAIAAPAVAPVIVAPPTVTPPVVVACTTATPPIVVPRTTATPPIVVPRTTVTPPAAASPAVAPRRSLRLSRESVALPTAAFVPPPGDSPGPVAEPDAPRGTPRRSTRHSSTPGTPSASNGAAVTSSLPIQAAPPRAPARRNATPGPSMLRTPVSAPRRKRRMASSPYASSSRLGSVFSLKHSVSEGEQE